MAIFGPKPWVNPFGKNVNFRLIELLCFYSLGTRFFCSRMSYKAFSWPLLTKKKKVEKWPFLDQNHGLTPLEKYQFFDFFNSLFF